jgi:hypothetical protein
MSFSPENFLFIPQGYKAILSPILASSSMATLRYYLSAEAPSWVNVSETKGILDVDTAGVPVGTTVVFEILLKVEISTYMEGNQITIRVTE